MKLTERQKRFADYYVETGNATEAARMAGYKGNNLNRIASENLTKLVIKEYIDKLIAEKDAQRIAKQDEVLEFLTKVLRGEEQEQVPLGMGMGAQELVKKELDGRDRIRAAELLGRRYGMWVDNHNVDVNGAVTIIDNIPKSDGDG